MNTGNFVLPVQAAIVFFAIFVLLCSIVLVGHIIEKRRGQSRTIQALNTRVYSWLWLSIILMIALYAGRLGMVALFFCISFAALREFMTQVYRRRGDHNAVATCFYILLPLQYYFVLTDWYSMFTIFIPIYAFLLLPIIGRLSGDSDHFFERTAKIQWSLMITVFCLSHVPALMTLPIKQFTGKHVLLLLFMIVVVQMGDVFYYIWQRTAGRMGSRRVGIGATLSVLAASMVAMGLYWITPFNPLQAGMIGLSIALAGFFGSEVMNLLKHNFGIRDWGRMIRGHGGMLDRVDSICFAAPVFFHIVRYYWT